MTLTTSDHRIQQMLEKMIDELPFACVAKVVLSRDVRHYGGFDSDGKRTKPGAVYYIAELMLVDGEQWIIADSTGGESYEEAIRELGIRAGVLPNGWRRSRKT